MSRGKAEAWAVLLEGGEDWSAFNDREGALEFAANAIRDDPTVKLVKLVQHDPRAAAVVRAALKHFKQHGSRTHSNDCGVCLAVERHLEGKR